MATVHGSQARHSVSQRRLGVGLLATTQGLDVVTTLYGLRLPGVVELNPVVAAAMARLGKLPGILCVALLVLVTLVAVTETAASRAEETPLSPVWVRCLGYVPHSIISLLAAVNNLAVAGVV